MLKTFRLAALPLLLLGACANSYSAAKYFQPALTTSRFAEPVIRTGNGPTAISVSDLDKDGTADLVVVEKNSDAVGIQPGKGGGRYDFLQYKEFPAGNTPVAVALGDFDGDGNEDLVVAAQDDNAVDVFLGQGDGGFKPPNEYVVGAQPSAVSLADLNSDGVADIVVADSGSNMVSILLGKADGTFKQARNFATGVAPVGIAMIDADTGVSGIVIVNSGDNTISILENNGDGSLGPPTSYDVGRDPSSAAVADVNGDKIPDVAVANLDDNTVSILPGKANGGLGAQTILSGTSAPKRIVLSDLDRDGKVDIITAGATGNVTVLDGDDGGAFKPPVIYSAGASLSDLAVADANGDGRKDVVVTNNGGINGNGDSIIFLFANGDGTLQARTDYDLADIVFADGIAADDVNGDSKIDIAVVYGPKSGGSILQTWINAGDGNFKLKQDISIPDGAGKVYVADVTGDGKVDLVTVGGSSQINIFSGDGAGVFTPESEVKTGAFPVAATIADFNGDGALDIATANYTEGTVSVHLGVGDGTFKVPYRTFAAGVGVYDLKRADFNKDGNLDIVTANYNANSASVLLGNGDGTFQAQSEYSSDSESFPESVATADFDADGNPDFAVAFAGTNSVAVYLGNGNGSFQAPVYYSMWWTGPVGLIAHDIDGDGDSDLLMADDASDNITVFYGAGDGTFFGEAEIAAGGMPGSLAVANFNGDDRLDMAVATGTGFSVIPGINRPPETMGGSFIVNEDDSLTAKLSAKDPDPDDAALTFGMLEKPPHGNVTLARDGTFSYTPKSGFRGHDQFTYNVRDRHVSSAGAVVQLHVESSSGSSAPSSDQSAGGGGGALGILFIGWLAIGVRWRRRGR